MLRRTEWEVVGLSLLGEGTACRGRVHLPARALELGWSRLCSRWVRLGRVDGLHRGGLRSASTMGFVGGFFLGIEVAGACSPSSSPTRRWRQMRLPGARRSTAGWRAGSVAVR